MGRLSEPRGAHGPMSASGSARARSVVFALLACTVSSPAWASYSEGFATLIFLYIGATVGAGAVVVSLALCFFGIFRNKSAFVTYAVLATTGTAFIVLIACFDTSGWSFLIAVSIALALLAVVLAPATMQYWLHRRRLRAEESLVRANAGRVHRGGRDGRSTSRRAAG